MFTRCAANTTPEAIATALNAQCVPAPQGNQWYAVTVRRLLRCRDYLGEMQRKVGDQTFVFPVEPLVPPDLWRSANAAMDANKHRARRDAKAEYLLGSSRERRLLRCRICHREGGEYMMGGRTKSERVAKGQRGEWYECSHWIAGRRPRHRVSAAKLEDAVWEALRALLSDEQRVLSRLDRMTQAGEAEITEMSRHLATLQDAEQQNRLAQARLIEMAARGRLAPDLIAQQEVELVREAESLAIERTRLEVPSPPGAGGAGALPAGARCLFSAARWYAGGGAGREEVSDQPLG